MIKNQIYLCEFYVKSIIKETDFSQTPIKASILSRFISERIFASFLKS